MYKTVSENLSVGDLVALGSYPQSEIKAEETIREVKKLCGSPRLSKSSAWFKYENCFGSGFLCD
ncbi:MAG: hypothetical protein K2I30_03545, partial [Clostridia bacterium]|nr:hypothetical protein [Clostridia bacterium]